MSDERDVAGGDAHFLLGFPQGGCFQAGVLGFPGAAGTGYLALMMGDGIGTHRQQKMRLPIFFEQRKDNRRGNKLGNLQPLRRPLPQLFLNCRDSLLIIHDGGFGFSIQRF